MLRRNAILFLSLVTAQYQPPPSPSCDISEVGYIVSRGHEVTAVETIIQGVSLAECQLYCSDNTDDQNNPITCASLTFDTQTQDCFISSERSQPQGSGELVEAPGGIDYYEKTCIPNAPQCLGGALFERYEQQVLVGHAEDVTTVSSLLDCLDQCYTVTDFNCQSVMFYYDRGECILNSETQSNRPDLFSEDTQGFNVDYFERVSCLDINVDCTSDAALVEVSFPQPQTGSIYVQNKFDTCRSDYSGETTVALSVAVPGRGGGRDCNGQVTGALYTWVVVVNMNGLDVPGLQAQGDMMFEITCDYSDGFGTTPHPPTGGPPQNGYGQSPSPQRTTTIAPTYTQAPVYTEPPVVPQPTYGDGNGNTGDQTYGGGNPSPPSGTGYQANNNFGSNEYGGTPVEEGTRGPLPRPGYPDDNPFLRTVNEEPRTPVPLGGIDEFPTRETIPSLPSPETPGRASTLLPAVTTGPSIPNIDTRRLRDAVSMHVMRDGEPVVQVLMAEDVDLRLQLTNPTIEDVDFFVRDCFATRIGGIRPLPEPLSLVSEGCPNSTLQFPLIRGPIRPMNDSAGFLSMRIPLTTFRFDGSHTVGITCRIDICALSCPPVLCTMPDFQPDGPVESFGKRRKRALLEAPLLHLNLNDSFNQFGSQFVADLINPTTGTFLTNATLPHTFSAGDVILTRTVTCFFEVVDALSERQSAGPRRRPSDFMERVNGQLCMTRGVFAGLFSSLVVMCLLEGFVVIACVYRRFNHNFSSALSQRTSTLPRPPRSNLASYLHSTIKSTRDLLTSTYPSSSSDEGERNSTRRLRPAIRHPHRDAPRPPSDSSNYATLQPQSRTQRVSVQLHQPQAVEGAQRRLEHLVGQYTTDTPVMRAAHSVNTTRRREDSRGHM